MSVAAPWPLKFQIGARTLWSVRRRLVRVPLSLDEALAGRAPALPAAGDADGYLVTSLPEALLPAVAGDGLVFVRQRYTRYWTDLAGGHDAWWAGRSGSTRSGLKRKQKRIGAHRVTAHRTPDELEAFHAAARRVAATTYQARLLGAALPDTAEFRAEMLARAAAGGVRAWLLWIGEAPVAYLYCPVDGGTVRYDYVGHDPAFGELSPGTVLHLAAFRDLFGEGGLRRFDFTEGEGQHKRSLASGGVACVDVLVLRPTLANRALVAALAGFDAAVAGAKAAVARFGLGDWARRVRRG